MTFHDFILHAKLARQLGRIDLFVRLFVVLFGATARSITRFL